MFVQKIIAQDAAIKILLGESLVGPTVADGIRRISSNLRQDVDGEIRFLRDWLRVNGSRDFTAKLAILVGKLVAANPKIILEPEDQIVLDEIRRRSQ